MVWERCNRWSVRSWAAATSAFRARSRATTRDHRRLLRDAGALLRRDRVREATTRSARRARRNRASARTVETATRLLQANGDRVAEARAPPRTAERGARCEYARRAG